MQDSIDDCLVASNQIFHGVWIHVHQKIEDIQWKPRYKEDNADAQNHDIGAPSFLVIFGMLTLKKRLDQSAKGTDFSM